MDSPEEKRKEKEEGMSYGPQRRERGREQEFGFNQCCKFATTSQCRENSVSDCGQTVRLSCVNYQNRASRGSRKDDLMSIFNSIAENENALVFRHRLDGQKRARYKKTVRRHMDFDSIKIKNCKLLRFVSKRTLPESPFTSKQCLGLLLQKNTGTQVCSVSQRFCD